MGGLAFESDYQHIDNNNTIDIVYNIDSKYRKDKIRIKFINKLMAKWRYGCMFAEESDHRNKIIHDYIKKMHG